MKMKKVFHLTKSIMPEFLNAFDKVVAFLLVTIGEADDIAKNHGVAVFGRREDGLATSSSNRFDGHEL